MVVGGAAAVGARLILLESQDDLDALFAAAVREGAQALVTGGGARMFRRRKELVALAAKHRLADVHYTSDFVEAGGLMSYAPSLLGNYKRAVAYVDRILKGARADAGINVRPHDCTTDECAGRTESSDERAYER